MWQVQCLNLLTEKRFDVNFWNLKKKNDFVRKCHYSKKIKVINIIDWSMQFD